MAEENITMDLTEVVESESESEEEQPLVSTEEPSPEVPVVSEEESEESEEEVEEEPVVEESVVEPVVSEEPVVEEPEPVVEDEENDIYSLNCITYSLNKWLHSGMRKRKCRIILDQNKYLVDVNLDNILKVSGLFTIFLQTGNKKEFSKNHSFIIDNTSNTLNDISDEEKYEKLVLLNILLKENLDNI